MADFCLLNLQIMIALLEISLQHNLLTSKLCLTNLGLTVVRLYYDGKIMTDNFNLRFNVKKLEINSLGSIAYSHNLKTYRTFKCNLKPEGLVRKYLVLLRYFVS